MFSCSFYILFVGFQSIHAFLIYFSEIFTRLLFAPFPLVCCIFNVFFQDFYPSPFCTISSSLLHFQCILPRVLPISFIFRSFLHLFFGCYRIFLHFHGLFPTCLLHRHSLFLAVTPVSSMFQQILHGLFLAFSSDRYHAFLKFHCIFQCILFMGFQYVLSRWSISSFTPWKDVPFTNQTEVQSSDLLLSNTSLTFIRYHDHSTSPTL